MQWDGGDECPNGVHQEGDVRKQKTRSEELLLEDQWRNGTVVEGRQGMGSYFIFVFLIAKKECYTIGSKMLENMESRIQVLIGWSLKEKVGSCHLLEDQECVMK